MVFRFGHSAQRETDVTNSYWNGAVLGAQLFVCATLLASVLPAAAFAGGIPCADNSDAICYGDFMGTTMWYRMVREEATTAGDSAPLFGMPTVAGNSLDFDPVGFAASAAGAGGVDLTDSNLAFMVEAKPGNFIQNIQFDEAGDTTLAGAAGLAYTAVSMSVFIDIEQVDGVAIDPVKLQEEMTFLPSDEYLLSALGFPLFQTIWTGTLFVDITQALMDNNVPFVVGATKISVNLDNTLSAMSSAGTQAVIAKKDNGLIVTTNIPEPASCLLALFGLAVVAAVARRSSR